MKPISKPCLIRPHLSWSLPIFLTTAPTITPLPHFSAAWADLQAALDMLDYSPLQSIHSRFFLPQILICLISYNLNFYINVTSSDSSLHIHDPFILFYFSFWHLSPHYTTIAYLLLCYLSLPLKYKHQDNRGLVPSCTDNTQGKAGNTVGVQYTLTQWIRKWISED